jgi:hypothetical protein
MSTLDHPMVVQQIFSGHARESGENMTRNGALPPRMAVNEEEAIEAELRQSSALAVAMRGHDDV